MKKLLLYLILATGCADEKVEPEKNLRCVLLKSSQGLTVDSCCTIQVFTGCGNMKDPPGVKVVQRVTVWVANCKECM